MTGFATARYVRFPPTPRGVWLPRTSRAAARAGIAMFGPSRVVPRAVQFGGYVLTSAFGPRALPGRSHRLQSAIGTITLKEIVSSLSASIAPVDALAFSERQQASRPGCAFVAVNDRRPIAFVRAQPDAGMFQRESAILTAVVAARPTTFRVPSVIATGEARGWEWIALDPLPSRPHRPDFSAPITSVATEITRVLDHAVRPSDAPPHWRPMHGDLAPWNLRRLGAARILFDWEAVDYAPPHADVAYYLAACQATRSRSWRTASVTPFDLTESADYWIRVIEARSSSDTDHALAARLIAALESFR